MPPIMKPLPCAIAILSLLSSQIFAQDWRAGAASVVITPEKPMWMAGYASRTKPAEGKLTELWAKALWLRDDSGNQAALITLDVVGVDRALGLAIRERIAKEHDLPLASVIIATSHTHSGPVVAGNLRPMHLDIVPPSEQEKIRSYAKQLEDWCSEVVKKAKGLAKPATLQFGHGLSTFAVNRRNNGEGAVPELRAKGRLVGPFDHDVPVLVARDLEGNPFAIVFGYACHATVLDGYAWCGDYPGYAQIEVEKAFPGAVAMFAAGCGADQNPIPRRQTELAAIHGAALGRAVSDVLAAPMQRVGAKLSTGYREAPLMLAQVPTHDELDKEMKSENRYVAARAKQLSDELAANGKLSAEYPYPVARWKLGDEIDWWFLGGEVVVDYALRLRLDAAPQDRGKIWATAYANDVMAYIPSRRVHREGGYEGGGAMLYYGLPSAWTEDVEDRVFALVKELNAK
jgi:neutral ceramidase